MKITYSIKVDKKNVSMLRKLECVKGVVINAHTKKMECYIEETKTRGRTTARQCEYIVRFASGEWQVFGGLSMERALSID